MPIVPQSQAIAHWFCGSARWSISIETMLFAGVGRVEPVPGVCGNFNHFVEMLAIAIVHLPCSPGRWKDTHPESTNWTFKKLTGKPLMETRSHSRGSHAGGDRAPQPQS